MCGISGFLDTSRRCGEQELRDTVLRMVNRLHHRGPDDVGTWADAEAGIALGHRRLSIVDLSPEGHQPMRSVCGRYVISFNGEIYNFQELRRELESLGYTFRGHSDTEVMLSCISEWGILAAVKRFRGMCAFALWDRQERELHLVRDRMGEKPLYYGWIGKVLIFSSELKALRTYSGSRMEVDRDSLSLFLRHNYVPAPHSIYKGVWKVMPGTIATISSVNTGFSPKATTYWSVQNAVERGIGEPFKGSEIEAVACLDELLKDSVKHQMVADVPLGAFLSGGIDSSTIVALMQAQSGRPVQTFTVGFHESEFNEATHAKAVAQHLGTAHTELYVTPEQTLAVIPKLPALYDEPFSDSSQVPTFLISEMAKRDVTVVLSGDAGDELFGGYERYFLGLEIWNKIELMPAIIRKPIARGIRMLSSESWNSLFQITAPLVPTGFQYRNPGEKLNKLAEMLTAGGGEGLYVLMGTHWNDASSLVIGNSGASRPATNSSPWNNHRMHLQERMMFADMISYLPDDILVKVDRASMGVSLESRIPFLDHRVVEFAWQIPLSMKIRKRTGKWLLRQVLSKYVPSTLIDRPKMGFGVPIDAWLRGPLREWAEDLLDEKRLLDEGFFHPAPIRKKWNEHLAGTSNWEYDLWDVLMFQAWLEHASQLP
jgi:asparagine synthase (glutamine-hydrolysing)